MRLEELYSSPERRRRIEDQEHIPLEVLQTHFDIIKLAYAQAGLDPADFPEKQVPGILSEAGNFQVSIMQTSDGEILGSHSLATTPAQDHVNETDILMWDRRFDTTSGRLQTPAQSYLTDYSLTTANVQQLTDFIEENIAANRFISVPKVSLLSLPQ